MSRSVMIIVSDSPETVESAKKYWENHDVVVHAFSPTQFKEGMDNSYFRSQLLSAVPTLAFGTSPVTPGSTMPTNVLQFSSLQPSPSQNPSTSDAVVKMVDMEAQLIEKAIAQCRGNLTEAAKVLGIGRATLYRKVKQFNIDPQAARRRKLVAA